MVLFHRMSHCLKGGPRSASCSLSCHGSLALRKAAQQILLDLHSSSAGREALKSQHIRKEASNAGPRRLRLLLENRVHAQGS